MWPEIGPSMPFPAAVPPRASIRRDPAPHAETESPRAAATKVLNEKILIPDNGSLELRLRWTRSSTMSGRVFLPRPGSSAPPGQASAAGSSIPLGLRLDIRRPSTQPGNLIALFGDGPASGTQLRQQFQYKWLSDRKTTDIEGFMRGCFDIAR